MILVITEKPSVAQSLARVIGAGKRHEGYLEGSGYLVSWCIGHLVELAPPEAYSEDTLLHSMETAGNGGTDGGGSETARIPEDAERRVLGTSATRAGIIEKLVKKVSLQRAGKRRNSSSGPQTKARHSSPSCPS